MKSVSKKIISLVLALVMMSGFCAIAFADAPAAVTAAAEKELVFSTSPLENEKFAVSGIKEGTTEDGVLTIPAVVVKNKAEYPIVAVKSKAFSYSASASSAACLKEVTEVVIEKGVTTIGKEAFANLPALKKVTFNDDVVIEEGAFKNCTALEQVVFKGSAEIGENVFAGCYKLADIDAVDGIYYECAKSAVTDTSWFKNYTVDFVTLGTTLIMYKGEDSEETIPLNITAIGASAFEGNTYLEKVVFTKYIDTLGDRAFANCTSLKKVVYSYFGDIKNIGVDVFKNTPYYDEFEGEFFAIGNTLIKYKGEDVSYVVIPNTITSIAANCFDGCYTYNEKDGYSFVISSILVPASVTTFGENCFDLAQFSDGESYAPRIYAYEGSAAMEALKDTDYLVTSTKYSMGDLDSDGKITAADARIALRYSVNLEEPDEFLAASADLDGDKIVTSADARIILRIAVGLEDYDCASLASLPKTKFEVLHAYNNAMAQAAKYGLGFTKVVSNEITASDICDIHADKILSIAQQNMDNQTYKYLKNQQVTLNALPVLELDNTNLLKNAKCVAKDGKYYITISFNDVEDCDITSESSAYVSETPCFASAIPTVSGSTFYNAISANKWYKVVADSDVLTANCIRRYALTYNNAKINAVIDAETGMPETVIVTVGYHFAVDGRINGVDISSNGFKTGDATVDRLDTVTYKNFN